MRIFYISVTKQMRNFFLPSNNESISLCAGHRVQSIPNLEEQFFCAAQRVAISLNDFGFSN